MIRAVVATHTGEVDGTVGNAHRTWRRRRGVTLTLSWRGHRGVGEASPLPDYSPDDADDCADALAALRPDGLELEQADAIDAALPAARFAFETALLDLAGHIRGLPVHAVLGGAGAPVAMQSLIDSEEEAAAAVARGVRTLKVKVGRNPARERALLATLAARYPDVHLRADANGVAIDLAGSALEWCEEASSSGVPRALDESLATMSLDAASAACAAGDIAALVLKPALLGGFRRCMALAAIARRHHVRVAVSHLFDGPIALAAACELALVVADTASGLDRHRGLGAWPTTDVPQLGASDLRPCARPGLGLAPAPDRLSLFAAPRARVAIVTREHTLYYRDLVEPTAEALRTTTSPALIDATLSVDTLVRLYACFERGAPAVLLHPRWTAGERAAAAARGADVPGDAAVVVFTSGSEGHQKGVVLDRAALIASAEASAANLGWRDDDRWLLSLPLAHVGGLSIAVRALLAGRAVVLDDQPFEPAATAALIESARVTLASMVPTMLTRMVRELPHWRPPAHLRAVLLGGAAASPALVAAARDRGWPVVPTYGMSETASQIATAPPGSDALVPLAGVDLRVGDDGRLAVRGPMLCRGYLPPDPSPVDDHGWLVTGDLGAIDTDGTVRILGRADDVIVTGGENVDPREVELALEAAPGVRAACVLGQPDDTWGHIVAAVIEADAVPARLCDHIADFKRPRRVVRVDAMPLGANGKVDRAAVRALLA